MLSTKCEKCGYRLVNNVLETVKCYDLDINEIITMDGEVDINLLPDYLCLTCNRCGNIKKISFEELKILLKNSCMRLLIDLRVEKAYSSIDKTKVAEENGISYCGICPGPLEGDGYCYKDVISQCAVRNKKSEGK